MKQKAFTLIELLVVVAIIGILAAVGVVAYNGYTKSAKESAVKAQHSQVVKYVTAELAKCNIESTVMEGNLSCNGKSYQTVVNAIVKTFSKITGLDLRRIVHALECSTPFEIDLKSIHL